MLFFNSKRGALLFFILTIQVVCFAQTALEFNGTTNYIEVPYSSVNNTNQFTVEHWVRLDGGAGTFRAPLCSRNYNANPKTGYTFYAQTDNTWGFWAFDKKLQGPVVVYGEWTHLAGTYDGTAFRFYVNGILVDTIISTFSPNTDKSLRIGAGATELATPNYYFPGIVDEVRIWNFARTASEINSNISTSLVLPQSGLVFYYNFNDGLSLNALGTNNGTLYNNPLPVFTTAPTEISGSSTICNGSTVNLTSSGGNLSSEGVDVWYEGNCGGDAFHEGWETQPYTSVGTIVNPYWNGKLNINSTTNDPYINMFGLGSFDPNVYKYINFRYKVVSGVASQAQLFFLNGTMLFADGSKYKATSLISDNEWHTVSVDMSSHSLWNTNGNITGFRFDYAIENGVNMLIDFIELSSTPIVLTGATLTIAPSVTTSYFTKRLDYNENTNCISQVVIVNNLPTPTFIVQPSTISALNTDVTYTTQSGFSNYIWNFPGVLNVDYTITSGGTNTDSSVVLKWLTSSSKIVGVNYSDLNGCTATTPTNSSATSFLDPFITTWQTDGLNRVIIPLTGGGYDFTIDWGDGTIELKSGSLGNIIHVYASSGIKTITITPNLITGFPRIYVNNFSNRSFLKTIEKWGSGKWGASVDRAFYGANNLEINATDVPDFSLTTNFQYMFLNCVILTGTNGFTNWILNSNPSASISFSNMFNGATLFNGTISNWDVSRVTTFDNMFANAQKFNHDISSWDVSNATNMNNMFFSAILFNQNISSWNVGNVTNMSGMFNNAVVFAQDVSSWNVSNVTDMNSMFQNADAFNQDISSWNVSNVINMANMFYANNIFNQNLSNWDVSSVINMQGMFRQMPLFNSPLNWGTKTEKVISMSEMFRDSPLFNQAIDGWDVSKVTTTNLMFYRANSFNQDLNSWNVGSLINPSQMFQENTSFNGNMSSWVFTSDPTKSINMSSMFQNATSFNRDISNWNVERVTNMNNMFYSALVFNQNLSSWNVVNVTNMAGMFNNAIVFAQDISGWNVGNVTNMSSMFQNADAFNHDINGWNVSKVTNMSNMFSSNGIFNKDLSNWEVSSVTNMEAMFQSSVFNSPLNWASKTANVNNMRYMFYNNLLFNQDINNWNITNVVNFRQMFHNAYAFNKNLSSWQFTNVANKTIDMDYMFHNALSFNQDISGWNISRVNKLYYFLQGGKLSRANYDALLIGWSTLGTGESQVPQNLNVHFGTSKYSNDSTVLNARNTELISNKGWLITDGGMDSDVTAPFIVSNSLAQTNSNISITFSENVYRTDVGSGTLEISDFLFSITGGSATLNTNIPISISTSNNIEFVLGIDLLGTPDGTEVLTVTPVLNSIFDVSSNVASTSQSNNTAQLYDLKFPVITGPNNETGLASSISVNENNTSVYTFSSDETVLWSLGNNNDEALFTIDSNGSLTFIAPPDFETPLSDLNTNVYTVVVIASDNANNNTTQTITIVALDIPNTIFGSFPAITKQYFVGTHTIVAPQTSNTNPIIYSSDNENVATVNGSVITFIGIGTATITATQNTEANYEGNSVSTLLTVLGKDLVSKQGSISSTNINYVNSNGKEGGSLGIDKYGKILDIYDNPVTAGLIMHLDAGNNSSYPGIGSVWTDLSGQNNNGTLINNPSYNSSNGGNLVFNGANTYVNAPLTKTASCTFSVWAKSTNANSNNMLFNAGNNGSGPDLFFSSGVISWNTWDSSGNPFGSIPATASNGNWHNYVVVNDAFSNTTRLYYDGILYGTAIYKNAAITNKLYIGGNTSDYMWNGAIGNFQVYNRVLTTSEVTQNFNYQKTRYGL